MKPSGYVQKRCMTSLILNLVFQKKQNSNLLFQNPDSQPCIVLHSATSTVEFSFDNTIYRQIDGVAMGSPLGPALANIFVGCCEEKLLFSEISKPAVSFRYVDDTFVIFQNEKGSEEFLIRLSGLHFSLQFTFEKEKNDSLPFLDIHVEHTKGSYETKVYRKPTFTGQYLRWESFTPMKRKASLVSTLVHRALKICSKSKLKEEINRIKEILLDNGYPEDFVLEQIFKKITQFSRPKRFGPAECPVYFRITCTGKAALTLERNLRIAVENCHGSVALRTVFVSRQMLPEGPFKRVPSSMSISATVTVGTKVEQLNDFKTASSSMFRNGYDSTQPPSECNLTERASENNPLQNVTLQLDNTY